MHSRDHFKFRLSFSNLPSVGWLNPDPKIYAEIRRANERGGFELVHRSDQLRTRSPGFNVEISGQKLCNGDLERTLKVQIYRYRKSKMESVMWGEFETSGNEIKMGEGVTRNC